MDRTETFSEWHQQRLGKFTASSIYKLFVEPKTKSDKEAGMWSETAMSYIFEKAVEEITGTAKQFSNQAMQHGVYNEPEALEAYEQYTGKKWEYTSSTFFKVGEYGGASPDALLYDGIDIVAVCDVKCPFDPVSFYEQKHQALLSTNPAYQNVPKYYFYQLQMQMLATGADEGHLVRYLTGNVIDQYGNKKEYALTPEQRIFVSIVHGDAEVQRSIVDRIAKAEETKQQLINNLK